MVIKLNNPVLGLLYTLKTEHLSVQHEVRLMMKCRKVGKIDMEKNLLNCAGCYLFQLNPLLAVFFLGAENYFRIDLKLFNSTPLVCLNSGKLLFIFSCGVVIYFSLLYS